LKENIELNVYVRPAAFHAEDMTIFVGVWESWQMVDGNSAVAWIVWSFGILRLISQSASLVLADVDFGEVFTDVPFSWKPQVPTRIDSK